MRFRKAVAAGVGLLMLSQGALVPRRAQASFAFEVAATVGWALALGWTGGSLAAVTINHFFELKNASTGKKVTCPGPTGPGTKCTLDVIGGQNAKKTSST